jgi:hypothetical protein
MRIPSFRIVRLAILCASAGWRPILSFTWSTSLHLASLLRRGLGPRRRGRTLERREITLIHLNISLILGGGLFYTSVGDTPFRRKKVIQAEGSDLYEWRRPLQRMATTPSKSWYTSVLDVRIVDLEYGLITFKGVEHSFFQKSGWRIGVYRKQLTTNDP